ncbi:MAG: DUF362 domain-containing protein [Deltaproteobacteria bacterium]|nr:DUF362 domain-containing protein [Deltaproteobacteria bacterium]
MSQSHDRREFIKRTALAGAALAISGHAATGQAAPRAELVKISGPGVKADPQKALIKLLEPLGGMKAFVKKGQTVMLKPNMGFATSPERRATTDPRLVVAAAKEAIKAGAKKVMIVDHPMRNPEACRRLNGIEAACKGLNVHLLLPMDGKHYVEKKIARGKVLKKTKILKIALEADVHIAMPLAKSHMAAGFSGGIKGHMGLVLDRESFHSRFEMNQAIADLASLIKTDLSIMDALSIMASGGPAGPGEIIERQTLLAGIDPVAVDAAAVELAPLYKRRVRARQIKHLMAAQKLGVGKLKPSAGAFVELTL